MIDTYNCLPIKINWKILNENVLIIVQLHHFLLCEGAQYKKSFICSSQGSSNDTGWGSLVGQPLRTESLTS